MGISDHLSEDEVELYSLRRLPDQQLPAIEEHLHRCEWCRALVKQTDLFHEVIQEVLCDLQGGQTAAEPLAGDRPRFTLRARRAFQGASGQNHSRPYAAGVLVARLPFENGSVPVMIRAMTVFGFEAGIGLTIWANLSVLGT